MSGNRHEAELLSALTYIKLQNCCWPTDHLIENIPFRRFFNVMFAKHIYPATGVKFFLGSICLPTGNNIPDVSHQIDRPR